MENDELNKEMVLELFYSTKGNIDKINEAIDAKLQRVGTRKITLFEKFVQARLKMNPKILKLPNFEITPVEVVYLSQHPDLITLEVLDLRKNGLGDVGMDAVAHSPVLVNLKELDMRNNQISRIGMESLTRSKTLTHLEKLDLRINKLGKRWEEKLKECDCFPGLREVRVV